MAEWVVNLVESGGYWAIALLMFLENVVPPIPSEVIMPLGGFAARRGDLSVWLVWLAGTAGSVAGQLPLYYLGYAVPRQRLKRWADRWGGWLTLGGEDIDKSVGWFERHGPKAVLLGRLVPGVRSLISIPAGMSRMPLPLFLLYSTVGMGVWAAALTAAGYALGAQWKRVEAFVGPAAYVVFGVLVAAAVALVIYRKTHRPTQANKSP